VTLNRSLNVVCLKDLQALYKAQIEILYLPLLVIVGDDYLLLIQVCVSLRCFV